MSKPKNNFKAEVIRSDVTAVPAAGVAAEAIAAFEIALAMREKFGGDSLREMKDNYDRYVPILRHANTSKTPLAPRRGERVWVRGAIGRNFIIVGVFLISGISTGNAPVFESEIFYCDGCLTNLVVTRDNVSLRENPSLSAAPIHGAVLKQRHEIGAHKRIFDEKYVRGSCPSFKNKHHLWQKFWKCCSARKDSI